LLPGDLIAGIDGKQTKDLDPEQAIGTMKGRPGTPVELDILRRGHPQPLHFSVVRDSIKVESVKGDVRHADGSWDFFLADEPRIGYVRLTNFGDQSVAELREALQFKGHPVDGLILDLRGNQGGLLTAAVEVCDLFIDRGVIVTTRGRDRTIKSQYEASEVNTLVKGDLPMAVLTNGASASASEIVAACLQDHNRAVVVGERSWGKGTVQNVIRLEGGKSALKLTTASYWRPSEKNIHRREGAGEDEEWGVRPDKGLEVKLTPDELRELLRQRRERDVLPVGDHADPPTAPSSDPQLKKAVDYLLERLREKPE
jgi:carboxyl-terminal processing protease